jgi:hypothetical protein
MMEEQRRKGLFVCLKKVDTQDMVNNSVAPSLRPSPRLQTS